MTVALVCSGEEPVRDTLHWAVAEVVDHVLVAPTWRLVRGLLAEQPVTLTVLDFDGVAGLDREPLVALLRQRYHQPIIGVGTASALEHARQLGVTMRVRKPVDVGMLLGYVRCIVEQQIGPSPG